MPHLKYHLLNQRFGRLLVIRRVEGKWLCRCDCGKEKAIDSQTLRLGETRSCGCLRKEFELSTRTHGKTKTKTYRTWSAMKNRCNDSSNPHFSRYGGRGIRVCERWANSFENFLQDMGEHPDNTSLDRINNDGNYEPGNCRWATRLEQERNKGVTLFFTIDGVKRSLPEWCEIYGVPYSRVHPRISRYGWDIVRALKTPSRIPGKCLHGISSAAPCAQCEQEIEATI